MNRVAAALAVLLGLGFGIPGVVGVRYFAQHASVWTFMGYPTYGAGPFTDIGLSTSVPLLAGFVAVCAAEVAVGIVLWVRPRPGAWLSIAIFPVELFFWLGFALPAGPVIGAARTAAAIGVLSKPRSTD